MKYEILHCYNVINMGINYLSIWWNALTKSKRQGKHGGQSLWVHYPGNNQDSVVKRTSAWLQTIMNLEYELQCRLRRNSYRNEWILTEFIKTDSVLAFSYLWKVKMVKEISPVLFLRRT